MGGEGVEGCGRVRKREKEKEKESDFELSVAFRGFRDGLGRHSEWCSDGESQIRIALGGLSSLPQPK